MTLSGSSVHSSPVEDVRTMAVTSVGHRTSDGLGSEAEVFMKWFAQGEVVLFGHRVFGFTREVCLPRTQTHKFLTIGFRRPCRIPNT